MIEKGNVFTGARARILVEGQAIGLGSGFNGDEEVMVEPIEILDNIAVQEHVPVGYRTSLNASMIWLVTETLKSRGLFPKVGANSGEHLTNVLNAGEQTTLIQDAASGDVFLSYEQTQIVRQGWNIGPRQVVSGDVGMVAIRVKDVSEV